LCLAAKRGLYDQIEVEFAAEVERLAALAVHSCGASGQDMRTVELAVRTAMTQLRCSLRERLLSIQDGHEGQRVDCGQVHLAEFVSYRTRNVDTVLGRIRVRRAYYHCSVCQRGVVPRDTQLGVVGQSLSPGLRRMVARVAAAAPFAAVADLLADLARIRLSTKRVERLRPTARWPLRRCGGSPGPGRWTLGSPCRRRRPYRTCSIRPSSV
jgi:hypothetical protein